MNTLWSSDLSWDTRVVYVERHQRWWWKCDVRSHCVSEPTGNGGSNMFDG
jgi:hypothetical protein